MKTVAFSTMNPLSNGFIEERRKFHRKRLQKMLEE